MVAVLLVGFNRPDLLELRLQELLGSNMRGTPIFLSVDGPRHANAEDLEKIQEIKKLADSYKCKFEQLLNVNFELENLGCDLHIFRAISKILIDHEATICIEDDVAIGSQTISCFVTKYETDKPIIISGMSTFQISGPIGTHLLKNTWRKSDYFSAWGYLVTRKFWENFSPETNIHAIQKKLAYSNSWYRLPAYKRRTWLERFRRGNIDYQIQLELFSRNIEVVLPLYRIVENTGLGDNRATHTYHKRPISMFGMGPSRIYPSTFHQIRNRTALRIWKLLDSHTWAGDGYFSVRGRNFGVRSLVNKIFSVFFSERQK